MLTSIRGNRLEDFIYGKQIILDQYISQTIMDGLVEKIENSAFMNWRAHD